MNATATRLEAAASAWRPAQGQATAGAWRPAQREATAMDLACASVTLAAAYALKRYYSAAGPSDLDWVLAPTAAVASYLARSAFVMERGVGYVCRELNTAIVPACAGVNYLIIALCTLVFGFVRAIPTRIGKVGWLAGSAVLAYVTTVVVNGIRIALAIRVHDATRSASWVSPGTVHCSVGVAVYLGSLWLLFLGVQATLQYRSSRSLLVPLFWYGLVTLVEPALNGAAHRDAFQSHAGCVVGVASLLVVLSLIHDRTRPSSRLAS